MAITLAVLRYFYRRCIHLDNKTFIDAIVESVTHLLFTSNDNAVFLLLKRLD